MIAVLFYVTDDTWSTTTDFTPGPDENLTPARIDKIRDELGGELARLKRSLAEGI